MVLKSDSKYKFLIAFQLPIIFLLLAAVMPQQDLGTHMFTAAILLALMIVFWYVIYDLCVALEDPLKDKWEMSEEGLLYAKKEKPIPWAEIKNIVILKNFTGCKESKDLLIKMWAKARVFMWIISAIPRGMLWIFGIRYCDVAVELKNGQKMMLSPVCAKRAAEFMSWYQQNDAAYREAESIRLQEESAWDDKYRELREKEAALRKTKSHEAAAENISIILKNDRTEIALAAVSTVLISLLLSFFIMGINPIAIIIAAISAIIIFIILVSQYAKGKMKITEEGIYSWEEKRFVTWKEVQSFAVLKSFSATSSASEGGAYSSHARGAVVYFLFLVTILGMIWIYASVGVLWLCGIRYRRVKVVLNDGKTWTLSMVRAEKAAEAQSFYERYDEIRKAVDDAFLKEEQEAVADKERQYRQQIDASRAAREAADRRHRAAMQAAIEQTQKNTEE